MIYSTTVKNETGIHARPAKVLVQEASKFVSDIKIKANDIRDVYKRQYQSILSLFIPSSSILETKTSYLSSL